ncbi:MAG: Hpt domain-containing protein [Desulfobulbaceae bacterium]|nr:Hpt domain-containing protein [Desulfobulbaceae bacterium]
MNWANGPGGVHMDDINWDRDFALEQAGGDEDLLKELLTLFTGTLRTNRIKMEEALADCDFSQVARAAHSIKGSASSLGFAQIAEIANAVEGEARLDAAAGAPEFLARLRRLEDALPDLA